MSRSQSNTLSQDEVFDILSSARRRFVLYHLREVGEPVELSDLARELAAWENETSVEELTKQQRKRVYVSLYQTHIQKLADAGIVDYDSDTGKVALVSDNRQIAAYLSGDADRENPTEWQERYIALAAASALLYALVAFDVAVFGLVSEFIAGVLILTAFAILSARHYIDKRRRTARIPSDTLIQDADR